MQEPGARWEPSERLAPNDLRFLRRAQIALQENTNRLNHREPPERQECQAPSLVAFPSGLQGLQRLQILDCCSSRLTTWHRREAWVRRLALNTVEGFCARPTNIAQLA